jgi:hypothetical protein
MAAGDPCTGCTDEEVRNVARDVDWALFEKAVEITGSALRGSMGVENSRDAAYAGEVFRAVWNALKEAAQELPDKQSTPGFGR